MHSEGREDKQVHMYKGIIPGPSDRDSQTSCPNSCGNSGIQDSRPLLDLVTQDIFLANKDFFFSSFTFATAELSRRTMQIPSAHCFVAVCLTLFGYTGDVYAGTVLMNSNAIKNLPGGSGGKGTETVSPSPRTPPSGSMGHKLPADTLQVIDTNVRRNLRAAPKLLLGSFVRNI